MPIKHATIPVPPAQVGETEWAEGHAIDGGTATVTLSGPAGGVFEDVETIVDASVTPSSRIIVTVAPHLDSDENAPDMLDLVTLAAIPGDGAFDVLLSFREPTSGPVKLQYWVT